MAVSLLQATMVPAQDFSNGSVAVMGTDDMNMDLDIDLEPVDVSETVGTIQNHLIST